MDIKEQIKSKGVKQWEVAEKIGVTEFTLSRWLRRPEKLNNDKTKLIEAAIEELKGRVSEEKGVGDNAK